MTSCLPHGIYRVIFFSTLCRKQSYRKAKDFIPTSTGGVGWRVPISMSGCGAARAIFGPFMELLCELSICCSCSSIYACSSSVLIKHTINYIWVLNKNMIDLPIKEKMPANYIHIFAGVWWRTSLEASADAIENKEICFGSYRSYEGPMICRRQSLLFASGARQLIWRREMRNSTVLRCSGAHHLLHSSESLPSDGGRWPANEYYSY